MTLDEAIRFLRKAVKMSHIPGQMHIDPALLSVKEQSVFDLAMKKVRDSIEAGEVTRTEIDLKLGI